MLLQRLANNWLYNSLLYKGASLRGGSFFVLYIPSHLEHIRDSKSVSEMGYETEAPFSKVEPNIIQKIDNIRKPDQNHF
jgi:hypothetical protein